MKKQTLMAAALALSLLTISGCTGGKTNGDGSVSVPSEVPPVSSQAQEEKEPGEEQKEERPAPETEEQSPDEELEQLFRAVLNYCESATGYRPGMVRIDSEDEEGITLQLYDDMGDHTATCAWYVIDPETMEGYDLITGEEIAFSDYMDRVDLLTGDKTQP